MGTRGSELGNSMALDLYINGKGPYRARHGSTLFDCATQMGIHIPTSCNKVGSCRECLVEIVEGSEYLSPPSAPESHLQDGFRLACRAHLLGESGVVRCHTMRRSAVVITETSDHLEKQLAGQPLDPAVTRAFGTILIDGQPITQSAGPLLGVAMDLGTTTVVLRLVDLESGDILKTQSFENPQRFGGSNVIARVQYDSDHPDHLLQRTLIGYLTHALKEFDCDLQSIYELVVVGNSTMRDIFFGLDVQSIGQKPFWSSTQHAMARGERDTTSLTATAKRLRLPIHPEARIFGMPIIHGHVGADAAACLLAVRFAASERPIALMDIGTNTELLVGFRDRILAASCPAGPAFEGGRIACGMPGLEGAIESVQILVDGTVAYRVIGNGPPQGICGSGLVDLLNELMRTGRINAFGRLTDGSRRFIVDADHHIYLSEEDISELAQAKAANAAGLRIVLQQFGIDFHALDRFYLAGGFAHHLNVPAARRVGMIPDLPDDIIVQVGNAAIEGATIALRSKTRRNELESLVKTIEHIELETAPNFFDYFVEGCLFNP
ncbi:MAG: DUF4445 domain-containing protein [Pirellulales bacterium]|nr:DUF4445 domain-containing protein [Pirellulales bacterium]